MATSLSDLLNAKTALAIYQDCLDFLSNQSNFKITNWRTGAPYRTLIELESISLEKLYKVGSTIASAILLDYSAGDWLTLLARYWFEEERQPSAFAIGKIVLTAPPGVGPYTIPIGGLTVSTSGGALKFRSINSNSVTLNPNSTVTLQVKAESSGARYNVAPGVSWQIDSPTLLGVTAANPVQGATGNWFDTDGTFGADEEPDEKLRERCRGKWATLPVGSWTADGYTSWSLKASSDVTKVKVASNLFNGSFADRYITLILAGPAGAVGNQAVTDVRNYVTPRLGICDLLDVVSAVNKNIAINAVVKIRAGDNTTANQNQILANLQIEQAKTPIGGVVYDDEIIKLLHGGADPRKGQVSVSGVVEVQLSSPSGETYLLFNETAVFTPSISFVSV